MIAYKPPVRIAILSYAGFIASWFAAALLIYVYGKEASLAYEFILLFICIGTAGIAIPVLQADKLHFVYHEPVSKIRFTAGLFCFIAGLGLEILLFGSWINIIISNPSTILRLKHVLVTLPMAIALCIQIFFMVPKEMELRYHDRIKSASLDIAVSAISFGLVMFFHSGFSDLKTIASMVLIGLFVAAGSVLTKKFFLTLTALFLIIYANSLNALKFDEFSWPMAAAGFVFAFIALYYGFRSRLHGGYGIDHPVSAR